MTISEDAPQGVSRRSLLQQALCAGASLPAFGLILSACGGDDDQDGSATATDAARASGTVLFWAESDQKARYFEDALGKAPIPGLDVRVAVGEEDSNRKLLASIAAGNPPDVALVGRWQHMPLGARGGIYAIDDRLEQATTFNYDEVYPNLQRDAEAWGHTWLMPFYTDSRALFYNSTLMEASGLDPSTPLKTWDDAVAAGLEVSKVADSGEVEQVGFSPTTGNPAGFLSFYSMLWMLGSDIVNEDKTQVTIDEKGPEALRMAKDLIDRQGGYARLNAATGGLPGSEAAFGTGTVGLEVNGVWMLAQHAEKKLDFEWGVSPAPVDASTGIPYNYGGGSGLVFFRGGDNPDGAWALAEYLLAEDFYLPYTRNFREIPVLENLAEQWSEGEPKLKNFASDVASVRWLPITTNVLESLDAISTMWDDVMQRDEDIDAAVETAGATLQEFLDESNETPAPQVAQL